MHEEPEPCSIIVLEEKDALELATLEASCFSSSWSAEQYTTLLRSVDARRRETTDGCAVPFLVLGLRRGARLAGYVSLGLHHAAGEAEIYNIAVEESLRGQGLSHLLMEHALRLLSGSGISRVFLEVRTGNAPAIALYAGHGFVACGRRKGYYPDTGEDALVFSRELP